MERCLYKLFILLYYLYFNYIYSNLINNKKSYLFIYSYNEKIIYVFKLKT